MTLFEKLLSPNGSNEVRTLRFGLMATGTVQSQQFSPKPLKGVWTAGLDQCCTLGWCNSKGNSTVLVQKAFGLKTPAERDPGPGPSPPASRLLPPIVEGNRRRLTPLTISHGA
jgi:hypothetical protein